MDKNKQKFACAVGPIKAEPKSNTVAIEESKTPNAEKQPSAAIDFKMAIVAELTKIMNIYKSVPSERGKVMGYQRAISNIKAH